MLRKAENREERRKLVVESPVVPQQSPRLTELSIAQWPDYGIGEGGGEGEGEAHNRFSYSAKMAALISCGRLSCLFRVVTSSHVAALLK